MQANEKKGLKTKISKLLSSKKLKKYLPIILTSTTALVLGVLSGGFGLFLASIFVAGLIYVQNIDAFLGEFEKENIAKLNRALYIKEEGILNGVPISRYEQFQVPANANINPKSYLMINQKDNVNLYYVDSDGIARKVGVRDLDSFVKKIREIEKNNSGNMLSANKDLNEIIKAHVIPNKLQKARRSSKQILSLVGVGIAIAGVLAALPFVGMPIAGVIAITSLGLGVALLAPLIGKILKKGMAFNKKINNQEKKLPNDTISMIDTELEIEKQLDNSTKEYLQAGHSKEPSNNKDEEIVQAKIDRPLKKTKPDSPLTPQTNKTDSEEGESEGEGETFHFK